MSYSPIRTPDDLARRPVVGITREDHYLDFKELDANGFPWKQSAEGRRECAGDVAQFANASGGTLLLGAADRDHVFRDFVNVPAPDDLVRWIDEVIKGQLEPVPPIEPHVLVARTDVRVVAVNVPPSVVLVSRRSGEGFDFPIRRVDSKGYMRLMEVEARMGNAERLAKLRLERIKTADRVTLDATTMGVPEHDWRVMSVDDDNVKLSHGELTLDVPLVYVHSVYPTREPSAAWVIALSARIDRVSGERPHLFVRRGRHL